MTLDLSLRQQLGDFALDVAFAAPAGVTVLFGPSGSGKSSIIRAVAGLSCPDQGHIRVAGRAVYDSAAGVNLPPHKRRLGVVFQDGRLFSHLTVQQNLNYGRWFAPRGAAAPHFRDVVDLLGIGHLLARRPSALSGGERQRVAIGRALLCAPDMILADEPLSALDEGRRAEILPYFEALRDAALVPILYVSHSSAEVARLATTVVALHQGRILAIGSARQILGRADVVGGAASVIAAKFIRQGADGLCEYSTEAGPIIVPSGGAAQPNAVSQLRIAAQDVMLARAHPRQISALNILSGHITAITAQDGQAVLVALQKGDAIVLARITQRSATALDLQVGQQCYAIVKTVALAN